VADDRSPIVAPRGASPAAASDPATPHEDGRWHIYEANPVPWWVALAWLAFIAFAIVYLIRNLIV